MIDRRLVRCGWVALTLHASIALVGAVRTPSPARTLAPPAEMTIDIVTTAAEAPPPVEPAPALPPPIEASSVVASRPVPRRAPRAPLAELVVVPSSAERAPAPAQAPAPEPSPDGTTPPAKRLTLDDLGLTGTSAAVVPPLQEKPPGDEDVGGLKRELRARDTELGLGPGGAVAEQIRRSALDFAPLNSEATLSVDLSRDGSIDAIAIDDVTSSEGEWRKVIRAVRQRLGRQFVARGGPMRITLRVTSRSSTRAGGSKGGFSFDLSNIGSPTMHWLHIRVLRQSEL